MHMLRCMCGSQNNSVKSVFSFYYMEPKNQSQIIDLGSMCFYPLENLVIILF